MTSNHQVARTESSLLNLVKVAEKGHVDSQYKLGKLYLKSSPTTALKWFKEAASKQHIASCAELVIHFYESINLRLIQPCVEEGVEDDDPRSVFAMSKIYAAKGNKEEAKVVFEKAVALKEPDALYEHAALLLTSDSQKAIRILNTLSRHFNHEKSHFLLGQAYFEGEVVEQNIRQAEMFLVRASKLHNENAKLLLAQVLIKKEQTLEAKKVLLEISDHNVEASYLLAKLEWDAGEVNNTKTQLKTLDIEHHANSLYLLSQTFQSEPEQRRRYLEKASHLQHKDALFELGKLNYQYCLDNKHKTYFISRILFSDPANCLLSVSQFTEAAKQHHVEAAVMLGQIYFEGSIIGKNNTLAQEFLTNFGLNNHHTQDAFFWQGKIYQEVGDTDNAYYCFNNASSLGHTDAKFELAKVLYSQDKTLEALSHLEANNLDTLLLKANIFKDNHQPVQAIKVLKEAVLFHDAEAQYQLGLILRDGNDQDRDDALVYLNKAMEQGHIEAEALLAGIAVNDAL